MALAGRGYTGGVPMPRNLELAYEAANSTLTRQDAALANLRNRATSLFAAAVITTAVGVIGDRRYPTWSGISLIVVLTLMAVAVLIIHWPVSQWRFGPSARLICELHDKGRNEAEIRRYVVDDLIKRMAVNQRKLELRQHALHAAIVLLLVEVVLILIAVTTA
jgi:hypothetical protein